MKINQDRNKADVASILVIGSIYHYLKENIGIIVGCLILMVMLTFATDNFMEFNNWSNVLRQITTNFYLAVGIMLAIILGGIDLSVGSVLAVSGVVSASLITNNEMSVILAIIIGCIVGTLIGLMNGLIIAYTDMPPFVVTLATMNIGRGIAYLYANGNPIRVENKFYESIGLGHLGHIPYPVIYMIIILIGIYFLMNKTKLGNHIYAVGGNRQAAIFSGISVKKVVLFVYTLSGLMASWAGIVLASRMASGQPATGVGYECDAVAAAVLGGTSMTGGAGKVGGMVLGALLIGMLNNGLNLLGVNSFWQYVVKGIVILVAVYIDIFRKRKERF